jgi:hypothetical protein
MKNATRLLASALGIYAALLGMEHGYFELLQGNVRPEGLIIEAFGPPCEAKLVWHACQPAMTIIPSFLITGILAMIAALIVLIWAAAFVHRRRGGLVLILLSILMLPVGGGFIPPMIGIIAGIIGTQIDTPLTWWHARFPDGAGRFLAALWPWALIVYFLWVLPQWAVGYFYNEFMIRYSLTISLVTNGLLLLSILTGFAHDVQRQTSTHQAQESDDPPVSPVGS